MANTNGEAQTARHEIVCDRCGKADTVPFAPKPGRSVLCSECFGASRIRARVA
jgi:CxxC-x17-CxxC domain-containing protein